MSSTAEIRELAASLVGDALVVVPVRHHSPACAWHLLKLFEQVTPSVVLVEGPRSFTPLVPLLADPDTRAPVAVYTYGVLAPAGDGSSGSGPGGGGPGERPQEGQRVAAFYPFCDYSPELVAVREAARLGVEVRFVDLDLAEQAALEHAPGPPDRPDDEPGSLLDETVYARSGHLRALADRIGCRNEEELWEHLFETTATTLPPTEHLAQLVAYCQLTRLGDPPERRAADGTDAREAEMAWHVRQALAERRPGDGPVLVVLGGYHAVALPGLLADPPARPALPPGTVREESATLVRYGFERLDRLNGYAAGMTSPAWHQAVWEQTLRRDRAGLPPSARSRADAALELLTRVAELARGQGVDLPMPGLQAAYEQALRLADLRGRDGPARDDVLDAVTSCFVKGDVDGDGAAVLALAREVLGGRAVGRVPRNAGTPPLVRDVLARCRKQRLKVDDADRHRTVLDVYRRAEHRATSRMLHGLALLGVPLGIRTGGPDFVAGLNLDRLQEHWEYSWSVTAEAALVEASVHGSTLPEAVRRRFTRLLDQVRGDDPAAAGSALGQALGTAGGPLGPAAGSGADTAAAMLVQACVLGLHDRLDEVVGHVRAALAAEPDFGTAARATGRLGVLLQAREPLEARLVPDLPGLLRAGYLRALFLAGALAEQEGADPATEEAAVAGLQRLHELITGSAGEQLDGALFWAAVDLLAGAVRRPLLAGAATGLAYSAGRISGEDLGRAVEGHLFGMGDPKQTVAFLQGVLRTAREAAWQEVQLLGLVDRLLRQWDEDGFVSGLPQLRLAFAALTPRETDRVAELVAGLYPGVPGAQALVEVQRDVSADEVTAHLALSRAVLAALESERLTGWLAG